jgi:hypothetical protein
VLNGLPLPNGASPGGFNLSELVKIGVKFHRLGKKEMYEFLRILPMSISDLLNEWFENETLKAAIAATAILNSFVGPRAQGTAYVLLHYLSRPSDGIFRSPGFVSGGINQLPQALARAAPSPRSISHWICCPNSSARPLILWRQSLAASSTSVRLLSISSALRTTRNMADFRGNRF